MPIYCMAPRVRPARTLVPQGEEAHVAIEWHVLRRLKCEHPCASGGGGTMRVVYSRQV